MYALYVRVSTNNQATGLESQSRALEDYCRANGVTDFKLFSDEGISGAREHRPGLDALMAAVDSGAVKTVVVYSFSRFARSTKHLLQALEHFQNHGVAFISLSERLDTSTPAGKMVFTVLAAVAELERQLIRERVKTGLHNARAKGKRLGAPKRVTNIDLMIHLASQGLPHRQIAKLVGCSQSTVSRELKKLDSKVPA